MNQNETAWNPRTTTTMTLIMHSPTGKKKITLRFGACIYQSSSSSSTFINQIIGTDQSLAAAYVSAGLPQFAQSALSQTPSMLGNVATLPTVTANAPIGKQIEGKCLCTIEPNLFHIPFYHFTFGIAAIYKYHSHSYQLKSIRKLS